MLQTDTLLATQAKAIESAQVFAQLVLDNAKVVAEMQYDATKNAVVTAVQSKVTKTILQTNQEAVEMFESVVNESKANLKKLVNEVSAKAPTGSEPCVHAFTYLINVSLQHFDQAYLASKDAHTVFEKSVDDVMSSFQGQLAQESRSATKTSSAITA